MSETPIKDALPDQVILEYERLIDGTRGNNRVRELFLKAGEIFKDASPSSIPHLHAIYVIVQLAAENRELRRRIEELEEE